MREAVAYEAELALLGILLDGVQSLLLGNLLGVSVIHCLGGVAEQCRLHSIALNCTQLGGTYLHLRISPAGDLDDHVEDGLLLVGVERDVVPC